MLNRLGALAHRRRRLVLVVWLLLAVVGFAVSGQVFSRLTATQGAAGAESIRGLSLINENSPYGPRVEAVLPDTGPGDPALVAVAEAVGAVPGVGRVQAPVPDADPAGVAALVAGDGRAVAVLVDLERDLPDTDAVESEVIDALHESGRQAGVPVLVGGDRVLQEEINTKVESDLRRAELIAVPVTLVVLLVVFGGFLAASLPLIGAVAAVGVAFPALLGFAVVLDLDPNVVPVTTFLGLGLAIDYALLMVSRYREERGAGRAAGDAVGRTTATAGRTILFSGLTVATSLSGLFVFSEPIFRAIAAAGVSVVVIAMAAALTLVPALLSVFGDRLKVPAQPLPDQGFFARLATRVQRRPWPVALGTAAVLVALGLPVTGVGFTLGGGEQLPRGFESRQVADLLAQRFPGGGVEAVTVVSEAPGADFTAWAQSAVSALDPGDVQTVVPVAEQGSVGLFSVVPTSVGAGDRVVAALRAEDPPAGTYVTGLAAVLTDFTDSILDRAPYALALVALASLVLLFLMTGSLVMPVKALVMNVVSLGATFGAVVWIFADGHLEGLLNFESTGTLETWLPVLIFAFAFGLSMDYEVFLLARVKESYDGQRAGHDSGRAGTAFDARGASERAVRLGLQRSGRIITSAALLIVLVFASLATADVVSIKTLGVALAIAVVVDATVVRCLLVPATMTLLGEWNWWAPAPLRRLHARIGLQE